MTRDERTERRLRKLLASRAEAVESTLDGPSLRARSRAGTAGRTPLRRIAPMLAAAAAVLLVAVGVGVALGSGGGPGRTPPGGGVPSSGVRPPSVSSAPVSSRRRLCRPSP